MTSYLHIIVRGKTRVPLKFVGSLFHVLFGSMDEDDREGIENNMRNVLSNHLIIY